MSLAELIRDPAGRLSEAKVWANAYKAAGIYVLIAYADKILADWMLLGVLLTAGIAPDVLKKIITVRAGAEKKE